MLNIIILPLIAALLAQLMKFFIQTNKMQFNFKNFVAYAGMPSSHVAMVMSLGTIVGLQEGWDSPLFGFAFIFAFLIIRDAIGLRQYLGRHGKILNTLVKDLKEDRLLDERYPQLIEKIGHTPLQALAGGIIGIAVSIIGYIFF
ncbi:MAG: divergent PAP2 family protein [Patescibacteria group bacterium]|mgnify:CR=1 FL=1